MAGFSFYTRKRKHGKPVYYVQFKQPDGSYSTAKSTGQTAKRKAIEWAENYLKLNGTPLKGGNTLFKEYSKGFYDWNGEWATNKRVEGKRIGERHCRDRGRLLKIHVWPVFGHMKLADIDKHKIRQFRNDLYNKDYSGSLINKCLYTLKGVLEDAEDKRLIHAIPKIERAVEIPKQKGILSIEEVNQLFSFEWKTEPKKYRPSKPQYMGYVANLLSASTGLRLSEIQGLQFRDFKGNYIIVRRAWNTALNKLNHTTKNGRERNVLIPSRVQQELQYLISSNPFEDNLENFIFYSSLPHKPAEREIFIKALYNAMRRIGITEEIRRERNITFHSWRHFLNSLLINAKIPLQKVQQITGHISDRMSSHYFHADDMEDVLCIQESLFKIE